jgi:hypothetical protein
MPAGQLCDESTDSVAFQRPVLAGGLVGPAPEGDRGSLGFPLLLSNLDLIVFTRRLRDRVGESVPFNR